MKGGLLVGCAEVDSLNLRNVFASIIFGKIHMNYALISGEFLFQCSAKGKLLSDVKDVPFEFQQLFIEKVKEAFQCPLHLFFHCHFI